jgi:hypothetical protein
MKRKPVTLLFIVIAASILLITCKPQPEPVVKRLASQPCDSLLGIRVADTIIYEVIIQNADPENTWTEQCLKGLNRSMLIDTIFNMIYDKRAVAYDYDSHEKLTPRQIQKLENSKTFSRKEIGMIQFTEVWYLNPSLKTMNKQVLSLVMGYNYYTSEGELFGHKPLFRVELNSEK